MSLFNSNKEHVTRYVTEHAQSKTWQKQFYAWLTQDGVNIGIKADKPRNAAFIHPGYKSILYLQAKASQFPHVYEKEGKTNKSVKILINIHGDIDCILTTQIMIATSDKKITI